MYTFISMYTYIYICTIYIYIYIYIYTCTHIGNFFWANCDHIAALPKLYNRFDSWSVEFYPFNISKNNAKEIFAENCGYSMHKCRGMRVLYVFKYLGVYM
jgi:hypothetical protein